MRLMTALLAVPLLAVACTSSHNNNRRIQVAGTRPGPCSSGQLGVFAVANGGGGAMVGEFALRNNGLARCTLQGRPVVSLLGTNRRPLDVQTEGVTPARRLRLLPQSVASVHFQWRNWCRLAFPPRVTMKLALPHGGGSISARMAVGRPRCDSPKDPSTLSVDPFQPSS